MKKTLFLTALLLILSGIITGCTNHVSDELGQQEKVLLQSDYKPMLDRYLHSEKEEDKIIIGEDMSVTDLKYMTGGPGYNWGQVPVRISLKVNKKSLPEKIVFLTIDDGPSSITPAFLDVLKSHNVNATFFVIGNRVKSNAEIIIRAYKEGNSIASHSYTHVYREIYSNPYALLDSIEKCNKEIDSLIKRMEMEKKFLRFPGGSWMTLLRKIRGGAAELLESKGYYTIDWNVESGDTVRGRTSTESIKVNGTKDMDRNVIVVLMHDFKYRQTTLDALPYIIKYYKDKGYVFRTLRDITPGEIQMLKEKKVVNVLY